MLVLVLRQCCAAVQSLPATAAGQAQFEVTSLGDQALVQRGFTTPGWWYWLAVGVLIGFIVLFNCLVIWAHGKLGRALPTDLLSASCCMACCFAGSMHALSPGSACM